MKWHKSACSAFSRTFQEEFNYTEWILSILQSTVKNIYQVRQDFLWPVAKLEKKPFQLNANQDLGWWSGWKSLGSPSDWRGLKVAMQARYIHSGRGLFFSRRELVSTLAAKKKNLFSPAECVMSDLRTASRPFTMALYMVFGGFNKSRGSRNRTHSLSCVPGYYNLLKRDFFLFLACFASHRSLCAFRRSRNKYGV